MSESATSLTSAKIDLLPHQVVLTHRVATASPRRFLIADEVGLGKTIETALILRELASRGELKRALMVVPAGLVNNWHRELNDVFKLDFEIFGREGDVSDRRSNAFARHDRLIASIDTLKRPARIKRLLDAPMWDLVVFDEAHHLTASRTGGKIKKTENYKLGEALREHSRDLLLLSATPHQGDHFRFFKLIQLLDPTLFQDAHEMVEQRHRLNPVVFRRTKADACRADGSNLFARRCVHTEAFNMSDVERRFYLALNEYLQDGFALAKRQGSKGRALGFVMTIFQKIAASSFAAVHSTLRRRLITLTVQEALVRDAEMDIDRRETTFQEARELIRIERQLGFERLDDLEVDRILTDLKRGVLKNLDEDELSLASDTFSEELNTAADAVACALPDERSRIKALLDIFPDITETKIDKLLNALGVLWCENPQERMVVFATYLGTVKILQSEIERRYPGQGVVVLKGGDHGSKLAAERRFKRADGPRVMIATAAGREGINLQHARILFNFDLPWNPMDVEQRIGRIHRYGQRDTAQVYNLVLGDTIEGRIFLLLDNKLSDIAKALGKVDEHGNVAEDLRSQILGQLSERINYQNLYSDALQDPELKRTRQELEAAMTNATEARDVVFELFQDMDRFSLDDYAPLSGTADAIAQLVDFVKRAAMVEGGTFDALGGSRYRLTIPGAGIATEFSTDRDDANADDGLSLMGLDHPDIAKLMDKYRSLSPEAIGLVVRAQGGHTGVLSFWAIDWVGSKNQTHHTILRLAVDINEQRIPAWECQPEDIVFAKPVKPKSLLGMLKIVEDMVKRELTHRGLLKNNQTYSGRLVGWIEAV
ncbi:DEAD/DEAH box helicase [Chromatium okenii]|uniref:DEAD/DEAH box helicase n=1 Tax=Chromatium okenii TaxID=61644 RepID=UPI0026EF6CEA|nr:SNF2-related protein [Chromatium okenii]MBV5311592.1 DEAD/DEAH box helicase family protein [Chromatium okenii]